MTETFQEWLDNLRAKRRGWVQSSLDNEFDRGIWNATVAKYADPTHFIFELLQNAEDAGASKAKELVFSGRFFDAEEALALGLIDEMVSPDGVYDAAAAWARTRRGVPVTVLEQFGPGHDRGSSHGSSRIVRRAYIDPMYVSLTGRAFELWREVEVAGASCIVS